MVRGMVLLTFFLQAFFVVRIETVTTESITLRVFVFDICHRPHRSDLRTAIHRTPNDVVATKGCHQRVPVSQVAQQIEDGLGNLLRKRKLRTDPPAVMVTPRRNRKQRDEECHPSCVAMMIWLALEIHGIDENDNDDSDVNDSGDQNPNAQIPSKEEYPCQLSEITAPNHSAGPKPFSPFSGPSSPYISLVVSTHPIIHRHFCSPRVGERRHQNSLSINDTTVKMAPFGAACVILFATTTAAPSQP
mmetsp:Transcript_7849/g.19493  ORF Transcript_7849/g.19493 Transcript_7849/m.19493 type:complete len:246 (+) Transcript_7849:269-1006(+)|eukprot:CAMPEP_0172412398 /NCGR_PEP_ID=MMETSP1061-20121228/77891_1 /TAXON_ID=37318 /ORGANISM="Pseudo-nitzschia pungens, Strain cf. pungens" /LENGTH=245 /DNA_ID=CAMNT_0013148637 /DNA_START=314 /DNA_END=1051 /DNA_ORIENTATION=-